MKAYVINDPNYVIKVDNPQNYKAIPTPSVVSFWSKDENNNIFYEYGNVGIGTSLPNYPLTVNGNGYFNGNLTVLAFTTITSLSIGSNEVISSSRQLKNIASLDAVTTATIESAIANAPNTFTDLNVTGISTLNIVTANSLNVGSDVGISTTRTTVATTSATTIDSFAVATYRSARVQVQITQGTDYQTSDILVIHNGSTASVVEYGSIATNDYLGTFSATVSGGNCLLQINMNIATSATVKVLSQRITV